MHQDILRRCFRIISYLKTGKYKYRKYLLLVEIVNGLTDLEEMRYIYKQLTSMYPLPPAIWLKLLTAELNNAIKESEMLNLVHRSKTALDDWFSFDIAIFCVNLISILPDENANEIWSDMMSTYGLHCMKGREMFHNCRQYYQLKNVDPTKLVELYETELSIPLFNMENTYIEFKLFCESRKDTVHVDWNRIDEKYNKAKEQLEKMLPFEKRLMELDDAESYAERSNIYQEYINECRHFLDDKIIQINYERFITDCCVNVQCWLNYIKFIQTHDRYATPPDRELSMLFCQTDWDIVNRAIRHCPWSDSIYEAKIRIAENMCLSIEDVHCFIQVPLTDFENPQPLISIWLAYLAFLCRNTNWANEREAKTLVETFWVVREIFSKYLNHLTYHSRVVLQDLIRFYYIPILNKNYAGCNNINSSFNWNNHI